MIELSPVRDLFRGPLGALEVVGRVVTCEDREEMDESDSVQSVAVKIGDLRLKLLFFLEYGFPDHLYAYPSEKASLSWKNFLCFLVIMSLLRFSTLSRTSFHLFVKEAESLILGN